MGTWGTGIFQNDVGDDIKTDYINKLKLGKCSEKALEELIFENQELLKDSEEAFDFWFALSSVMYDYGRLTETVKNKVLAMIDSEEELKRWSGTNLNKRKKELLKLKEKITSDPKPEKKVSVLKRYITKWAKNDIYYAKISDICNSDKEGFLVFLVHDIIEYDARLKGLGDQLPVTYVKYLKTEPNSIEDIDKEPFVKNFDYGDDVGYKFLWLSDGFKKASSKFVFWGNQEIEKPDTDVEMSFNDKLRSMLFLSNIPQYI